jgi:phosphoribosylanthranilate isomerase
MTWVKICGMTNLEDALVAVDAGADAVGFVFYEKSPRYVNVETAQEIVARLPEGIEKVGVFVGVGPEAVAEMSRQGGLTIAQIYTTASFALNDEFLARLSCRVIAAISTRVIGEHELCGFHVSNEVRNRVVAVLVDSGNSERPGGTGETFDWANWENMVPLMDRAGLKLVVAGGLKPENVGQAMATLKPWGVDVASGVEAQPGKKDPEKVRAFVRAVREADKKAS